MTLLIFADAGVGLQDQRWYDMCNKGHFLSHARRLQPGVEHQSKSINELAPRLHDDTAHRQLLQQPLEKLYLVEECAGRVCAFSVLVLSELGWRVAGRPYHAVSVS